ncbi:MAG: tripartite tricarboxylate transporter substrate binding protein [Betaproteobacteria bacterium]|nr:tripartite tricarboxylate transporter substrate binding protein [Betaproteobacteria bacterium]
MRKIYALICGAGVMMLSGLANAQSWPVKPVRLVISTGSGTSPDRIGRIVADRLSKDLGQTFIAENITGAGGIIAPRMVAKAPADGYTLLFCGVDTLVTNPYTVKDLGYDPQKDFDLISMIYKEGSLSVVVHPSVPAKTLPELFALAKKDPGKLSYGTTSVNFVILFGRWLNQLAGTEMLAVAYKAPAQQFQDVLEGHINAIISSPPTVDALMKAGKLRVLAVDGSKRFPLWPDVPNIFETFPGFRLSGTGLLAAPKGTPEAVIRAAHGAMNKILTDKSYQQALLQMGFTVDDAGTPESMRQHLKERDDAWQKVFTGLGVKPE